MAEIKAGQNDIIEKQGETAYFGPLYNGESQALLQQTPGLMKLDSHVIPTEVTVSVTALRENAP